MAGEKGTAYVEDRYEQELHRGLGLWGNIAITLSAVTPASSVFIIVPGALLPALLIKMFGVNQADRVLEEVAK